MNYLELPCELVNRPVVAANISSPAFFRVSEEVRSTLLIDEADTLLRGNEELRGILNAGYGRKTVFVVRVASEVRRLRLGSVHHADHHDAGGVDIHRQFDLLVLRLRRSFACDLRSAGLSV